MPQVIEQFLNYMQITPKTAENFRKLCIGDAVSKISGKTLHYKGSSFHKILPQFMCQGGYFPNHNGTGGESIYRETFPNENFTLKHSIDLIQESYQWLMLVQIQMDLNFLSQLYHVLG